MHDNFSFIFYFWAKIVVHFLLPKRSMALTVVVSVDVIIFGIETVIAAADVDDVDVFS